MVSNTFEGIKGTHITHLNIRSLVNKIDIFRQYLSNSNISIAAISESETWLHKLIPGYMVNIEGYQLFRSDRTT